MICIEVSSHALLLRGCLYMPRAQGGRGLLSVKDCVELEISNFFDYAANNNEKRQPKSCNQGQRLNRTMKNN